MTPVMNKSEFAGLGAPAATWIFGDLATLNFEIRQLTKIATTPA